MKRLKQSVIKWVIVSLFCLLLGFLIGYFKLCLLQDSMALMDADLQKARSEKIELSKEIAGIEADLAADKQTIKLLTLENKELNDQLIESANKLYFYERVVAPELQVPGMQIYSFSIHQIAETGQWNYELVLMQAQKGRRFLKGKFDLSFSVFENEQLNEISISEFSENFTPTFNFKYFQTITGVFTLPEAMQVDEVVLKLNVSRYRNHKAQVVEQRYDWQTLITNDTDIVLDDAEKLSDLNAENVPLVESNTID